HELDLQGTKRRGVIGEAVPARGDAKAVAVIEREATHHSAPRGDAVDHPATTAPSTTAPPASSASISDDRGIAVLHERREATIAPAAFARRTASSASPPAISAAPIAPPAPSPLTTGTATPGTSREPRASTIVAPSAPRFTMTNFGPRFNRSRGSSAAATNSLAPPTTTDANSAARQASSGYSRTSSQRTSRQSRSKIARWRQRSSAASVVARLGSRASPVPDA